MKTENATTTATSQPQGAARHPLPAGARSPSYSCRTFGQILDATGSDAEPAARRGKDLQCPPTFAQTGEPNEAGERGTEERGDEGCRGDEQEPSLTPKEPAAPLSVRELQVQQAQHSKESATPCAVARVVINPAVQDIARQMLRNVSVHRVGERTDLRLQIETRRMPTLGLSLRLESGKLRARFSVPDRAGQDLLRSMAPELEAALETRGLQVNAIQVESEASPAGRQDQAGERHGQRRGGQEQQQAGGQGRRQRKPRLRSRTDYVT